MKVGSICSKEAIALEAGDTVAHAAQLMRDNHVGAVVVHESGRPVGIVTDRDIVLRAGGRRESIADVKLSDVATTKHLFVANEDDDILDALDGMRRRGVRRCPVVNDAGLLAGVLTLDDILLHLARNVRRVADVILSELGHEH